MAFTHFSGVDAEVLAINGTTLTVTAAELNALSSGGLDSTELAILDGATVTTAELNILDGCTCTYAELNNAADVSARVEEVTASGAVTAGVQSVELNTAAGAIAATIADASTHQGLFIVKQTDAGTDGHTLTLTAGTWDGTNNVATLDAQNEALIVYFDSAGNGTIVENVGSVALS